MLLSSWALLTMEEKIISVEEKIIWNGLKKKKSVFSERMTVKNSTLLLVYKQIFPVLVLNEKAEFDCLMLQSIVSHICDAANWQIDRQLKVYTAIGLRHLRPYALRK